MVIKFPLEMKDGVQVRNITDLKENFDVEKVVGYFLNGKLMTWLEARYYEEEAEAVSQLEENDSNLANKLCEIFGVEYECAEEIDTEELVRRNQRIAKLKQFTDNDEIIANIDLVAFDQEELADLYDKGIKKLYLCEGEFFIPKSKQDLEYILIGEPNVVGLVKQEDSIPHKETYSCDNNMSYNGISEELADIIGLRPFLSTDDYIVFFDEYHGRPIFEDEADCFVLCNKHTKEMSPFHISGYDSKWTELLEAVGNKIFLGNGNNILLYDLETQNSRIIGTNVCSSYYFSANQEKVVYIDKDNRLLLHNLDSHDTIQIAQNVFNDPITLVDNKVFYTGNVVEDGYWQEYFFMYEIDLNKKTKLFGAREESIKQMISYNGILYILGYNVWNESVRFWGLNIDNPKDKYTEIFRFSWKSSSSLEAYIERAPYFVFIKAESGFPMYVFDMESKELKQVASGCGHTLKKAYYTNQYFQVVGEYLYFIKGDDYCGLKDVYRINLLTMDGEKIVGNSEYRNYRKNKNE